MSRPLYRLGREQRAALAAELVGERVAVIVDRLRGGLPHTGEDRSAWRRTYRGRLVAVAGSIASNTTNEVIVFTTEDGGVKWAPLSVVESITREEARS